MAGGFGGRSVRTSGRRPDQPFEDTGRGRERAPFFGRQGIEILGQCRDSVPAAGVKQARPCGRGIQPDNPSVPRVGIAADQINPGGGGADIGPSVTEAHIPAMSLDVDGSKYFLIHHTPADTIDKIDAVEMAKCAAAVAVMAYVVADMPQRLGE